MFTLKTVTKYYVTICALDIQQSNNIYLIVIVLYLNFTTKYP